MMISISTFWSDVAVPIALEDISVGEKGIPATPSFSGADVMLMTGLRTWR
ncbi:hypothetical protein GGTG_02341 [Gaeumannomyces tritici R3-111a-1]|uniref:Uncharacterized protein n=1 Tax=Gaeumannomyces tritici (strain R3-111a-1) TaxID=644352 RepID=J3NM37_GAET3|nr:hypothetical protein GGTG_02341 [Gaeumannomyces tritici R3-111a-1]EJT82368.1 hypothetical protein GGTG_02341 [Gaeumannomyces tritici R3-111a-1]